MPDSFPQFGFLPWELRHAIWTLAVRPPGSGVYFVKDENSRNLRHTWALDDRELYEHASTFEIDSGLWSACRESKAVIQEVYRKRSLHPFIIPSRNKQSNLIQSDTGEPIVSFVKHDTPELDHPKELERWTETPLLTILPRADLGICKIELWPSGCPKLPQSMHPFVHLYSTSPAYGQAKPEYLQEMWKHLRFLALDIPPVLWRLYRPSQGKSFPTSPLETLMVEISALSYPHLYPHLETIFIIDWELKTRPEVGDFARLPIEFTGNGVRFVAYQYVGKTKEAHELPRSAVEGTNFYQTVRYTSKSGVNGHDIVTSLEHGDRWEVSQRVRLLRGQREIKLGVLTCEKYL